MVKVDIDNEEWKVRHSDEYKTYLSALCRMASGYVARIRMMFAEKAYDMFKDKTIRKLVLAYGDEVKELEEDRLFWFTAASEHGSVSSLEDSVTNHAAHYRESVWFLSGLKDEWKAICDKERKMEGEKNGED